MAKLMVHSMNGSWLNIQDAKNLVFFVVFFCLRGLRFGTERCFGKEEATYSPNAGEKW